MHLTNIKQYKSTPSVFIIIFIYSYYVWSLNTSPKAVFYLCFGGILIYIVTMHTKPFETHRPLLGLAIAVVLYFLCSTLWATPVPAFKNFIYHSKRATEIIALIVFIAVFFNTNKFKILFKGAIIIASLHSIILIFNQNLDTRLTNPIDTGMTYGITAVIALHLALQENKKQSILSFIAFTILSVVLLITKSRGPQLSLVITSIVLVFIQREQIKKILIYLLCLSPILLIIIITTDIFSKIFSRGFHINQRDIIWHETIVRGYEHFWFGLGMQKKVLLPLPNGFTYTHSHNFILDTFRLTGFIGCCLICILFLYALYKGFSSKVPTYQLWALILLFGGLCLMTNGSIPFSRPSHAWLAFWIPIAMICTQPQLNNKFSSL